MSDDDEWDESSGDEFGESDGEAEVVVETSLPDMEAMLGLHEERIPKTQPAKKETEKRRKKKTIIQKKEEEERARKERLEAALKKVSLQSGRELSEREKRSLVVEKSDNLLCEDLFGDVGAPVAAADVKVLEGEDLMGGGEGGKGEDTAKAAAAAGVKAPTGKPEDIFEDAIMRFPLNNEMDYIVMAKMISDKLNKSTNSTNVVQFIECLIKAVAPSLDSSQYKGLSSTCNVQKNAKQKEEQKGNKKKILKMRKNDDDFMGDMGAQDEYQGDAYW